MKLLLDTCTFLWIAADAPQLSARVREAFSDPANEVFLSVISSWEIAIKNEIGKLALPRPPREFVPEERARHGIDSLELSEEAALAVSRLPALHKDPFDRMLVCQAVMGGFAIATPDPLIKQYPVPIVW